MDSRNKGRRLYSHGDVKRDKSTTVCVERKQKHVCFKGMRPHVLPDCFLVSHRVALRFVSCHALICASLDHAWLDIRPLPIVVRDLIVFSTIWKSAPVLVVRALHRGAHLFPPCHRHSGRVADVASRRTGTLGGRPSLGRVVRRRGPVAFRAKKIILLESGGREGAARHLDAAAEAAHVPLVGGTDLGGRRAGVGERRIGIAGGLQRYPDHSGDWIGAVNLQRGDLKVAARIGVLPRAVWSLVRRRWKSIAGIHVLVRRVAGRGFVPQRS